MILANRPLRGLQVITVDTEMPFRSRLLGGFFFNCGVGSRVWRCCRVAVEVATDPQVLGLLFEFFGRTVAQGRVHTLSIICSAIAVEPTCNNAMNLSLLRELIKVSNQDGANVRELFWLEGPARSADAFRKSIDKVSSGQERA